MTPEERKKIKQEVSALFDALKRGRRDVVGFTDDQAVQLVAAAMPSIIQDVRLEELQRGWANDAPNQYPQSAINPVERCPLHNEAGTCIACDEGVF